MREQECWRRLMLNGSTLGLGSVTDIIDQEHGRHGFEVALHDGKEDWIQWDFPKKRDEMFILEAGIELRTKRSLESFVSSVSEVETESTFFLRKMSRSSMVLHECIILRENAIY